MILNWFCDANRECWLDLLKEEKINESELREYNDIIQDNVLNNVVFQFQKVSLDYLREHKNDVEWGTFNYNYFKNEHEAEEFKDKIDWITLSRRNVHFSEQFYDKYKEKWDWAVLLKHNQFSMKFLRDHLDYLDWEEVSYDQELEMDFIEEFKDKLDWDLMSGQQKFTPEMMEKYFDKIDWQQFEAYNKSTPIPWPIYKRVAKMGLWDPYNRQEFNIIREQLD